MSAYDICVIGGGAAGFFAAIQAAEFQPGIRIAIAEKSDKLLSKVKVSGGGRCNVTHQCPDPEALSKNYPRGADFLLPLFRDFGTLETIEWFESKGIRLKTEKDGRMFPVTDDSQTIIDLFSKLSFKYKIDILTKTGIEEIKKEENQFNLSTTKGQIIAKKVIICSGGSPKASGFAWLNELGIKTISPCPSLFTFNIPQHKITELAGVSVENATVYLSGTPYKQSGPILITHWGLSGPAVIKLSAWQARGLFECGYKFDIKVSWLGEMSAADITTRLKLFAEENLKKQVKSLSPFAGIPTRLWQFLVAEIVGDGPRNWAETGKKTYEAFAQKLSNYQLHVSGKTTFKEEFVTCGGVDLLGIDPETMESRNFSGCYFAGEILDIDGITGGFNFQAAWTTARLAGISASDSLEQIQD